MSAPVKNVTIVGASGRVGNAFAKSLLESGKHVVTALIRPGGRTDGLAGGIKTKPVDYDDDASIEAALVGTDFLIITLAAFAPPDLHGRICRAAGKAGIRWIMPNVYGTDFQNERLATDSILAQRARAMVKDVEDSGASWITLACGFWYEWSLGLPEPWYGFTISQRKVTLFDDGDTKITTTTWDQCGRAIAALLSLPEKGSSPSLSDWKDKALYMSSFLASQRDMLDALHRQLGTTDKDWEIQYEKTDERYKKGLEDMQKGDRRGFARAMYSRIFYPNGDGNTEAKSANKILGLPQEDFDEATRQAIKFSESDEAKSFLKAALFT